MPDRAVRALVQGRVHGVMFRDSTRREAERLGVAGWVRNRADGTVEMHAEGPAAAVDELVAWLQVGPPHASVSSVEVAEAAASGDPGFAVR